MKRTLYGILLGLLVPLLAGCAGSYLPENLSGIEFEAADKLLLVAEGGLASSIGPSLDRYVEELASEGRTVYLRRWEGGGARDLKALIRSMRSEYGIDGAFLVGDLPAAWYEQEGFTGPEQFPCDLYFMDLAASWEDADADGVLDSHSPLDPDIFVSRVQGNPAEVGGYFDKVRRYRSGELSVWKGAYIFKDNDWADYHRGSSFELSSIYSSVVICEDPGQTVRAGYFERLTGEGAEYVYQWIHACPPLLCIRGDSSYEYVHTQDISARNLKGMFYNLYNCSAARFTQDNLAMTYLLRTDYGLAALGSTKVGGNYYPRVFHHVLSRGGAWGEAFKAWYRSYGSTDDKWFLGMVILGDPALVLSGETRRGLTLLSDAAVPPSPEEVTSLESTFLEFGYAGGGPEAALGFEEYRSKNPQFFE